MNPSYHGQPQMHRGRRRSLPFISLLSLSLSLAVAVAVLLLFLYPHRHPSLPLLAPQDPTPLYTTRRNPGPLPSDFTFTVKVLAFDRIDSLRRCLRSLSGADYAGDRVDLHVYVDHFRDDVVPANGSDLVDRKLEESRRILGFLDGFGWRHGEKLVHYRTGNAGLQAQWVEAWWPGSDDEFAFVVEDDLEVSPLYYKYLRGLIAKYYYDPSNSSPLIYGASLQRPRFVPGKHGNKLQLDNDTHLFLYQLVGTWGQLLFPNPWKEFRLWYDAHKTKGIKPILQGMVTTGWYKKMGEKIWTPWFIKFIHSRGYYNIYTNLLHERALSISHRDAGVNYRKSAGPDSFLIDESSIDFSLWEMQPLRNLKRYDFCFREVDPERVVRSFEELGSVINSLQKDKTVLLISLYRTAQSIARNLLCHLEMLNIQNYIFIGTNSELLIDLARKGHAVIDSDQLINSIRRYKLSGLQHSELELVKEILVKAYVIKKSLECGYNSWVVEGNMIPISDAISEPTDPSHEFFAAMDEDLLFAKNSPNSLKIWDDKLIDKMAGAANSLVGSGSNPGDNKHFVYFAVNALEEKSGARIERDGGFSIGVKLGTASYVNKTLLESGKRMVFWSPRLSLDSLQRELESLGLWLIDGDSSCTGVFCHQS